MGSTDTQSTRNYVHPANKNVALHCFNKGEFADSLKELRQLHSGAGDIDVIVVQAICEYRLGQPDALALMRGHNQTKLTQEHIDMLFRHEVLGHIQFRRFEMAIELLEARSLTELEQSAIVLLRNALTVLRNGQSASFLKRRPERAGIVPPREVRSEYLPMAFDHCYNAVTFTAGYSDGDGKLISILAMYMTLVVELLQSSHMQNRSLDYTLRRELRAVDSAFKRSIPTVRRVYKFHYRF
jgi:hypothetical protein